MWWRFVILTFTVASCFAVPRASAKRELQRLVRLPQIEFASPFHFDRTSGFVLFPMASAAAAEAAELLKDAKGNPTDALLHLDAARIYAAERDLPSSIRSYARAADLFGKKIEAEPQNADALIGLADALSGLGRFGEAHSALQKAALINPEDAKLAFARARFHKEKAWTAFSGEENRFTERSFLEVLELSARRVSGRRIDSIRQELKMAREQLAATLEATPGEAEFLRARSAVYSVCAALEAALEQAQQGERDARKLSRSIFAAEALADLDRAAERPEADPLLIATTGFAAALGEANTTELFEVWPQLNFEAREQLLATCRRLQGIADSGSKDAAEAAEYVGCLQICLVKDFVGAERSFRAALRLEPSRERSWDLLVYSIFSAGNLMRLAQTSEERSEALPNARSSALLIKSYERLGDSTRAEWSALSGATAYPHDFFINLSLAAVLMKREGYQGLLWRVNDALNKAEKQLTANMSRQNHLDFVVLKSIFLGLSDQPEQAKSLLRPFATPGRTSPAVQEVLQALEW